MADRNNNDDDHAPFPRQQTEQPGSGGMSRQVTNASMSREVTNASMGREFTDGSVANDSMAAEQMRLMRPLYTEKPRPTTNSEHEANIFSLAFLFFMHKTLNKAVKLDADMEIEDLDPLIGDDQADVSFAEFRKHWTAELAKNPTRPNLIGVIFYCCRWMVLKNVIYVALECLAPFTSVVLMTYINDFVVNTSTPWWQGGLYACILFVMNVITAIGTAQSYAITARMSTRIMSYIQMEMVRKTIQLTPSGAKSVGQGMLFQVFNGDCTRLAQQLAMVFRSFDALLQMIGAFIYLGFVTGWPACAAVGMFLMILPVNYRLADSFFDLYKRKMIAGDKRTQKVIEVINNVRVVKFYGWERPFRELVRALRAPEVDMIARLMRQVAILMCSFSMATPIIQVVLFVLLTVKNANDLTVLVFFQALSLLNILNLSLTRLPVVYSSYMQVKAAEVRLVKVFTAEELPEELAGDVVDQADKVGTIEIENADFVYFKQTATPDETPGVAPTKGGAAQSKVTDNSAPQEMRGVTFRVNPGDFVMVVGKVGSGKSSLINAILGEMVKLSGTLRRKGTIAYVPQQAWILNATVRNNITLNLPYDKVLYERVLDAVDLRVDLRALPNSDLTEVGEKGINLSGGQRARISIARALYQQADIYILDDPLSALDAHVGRHVFVEAFQGMLASKTRILVTHQMAYLNQATRIYVASNMHVKAELLPTKVSETEEEGESSLVTMMRSWRESATASSPKSPDASKSPAAEETKEKKTKQKEKSTGKLTMREERQSGKVSTKTLFHYLRSFGGVCFWAPMLFLHSFIVCCNIFSQLWMGFWTGFRYPSFDESHTPTFFIGIYTLGIGLAAVFVLFRELLWRVGSVNAPRVIYDQMMGRVLRAPMSFFDTTPVGRIINRFTKDAQELDFTVPMAANQVFTLFFSQLGSMIAICVFLPYFSPIVAVCLIALFFVQPPVASVVLRRLSNSTAGPVAALFSEAVNGAVSIRTLHLTTFFSARFSQLMDAANAARFSDQLLFECIRARVNVLMALVSASMMLIIMAMRDQLSAYDTSFLVSQGMQVTLYMGYMMLRRGNLTLALNSVERLTEYCNLEQEESGGTPVPDNWPAKSAIEFRNVTAQYRKNLPVVLRNVSMSIRSGEKIGICGRTGCGKSSLLLTLFRLIPLLEGSEILIDGVDISTVNLDDLRGRLAVIPQEPVLFSGTVRDNLDPFKTQTDASLMNALEVCQVKEPLEKLRESKTGAAKPDDILSLVVTDTDLSVGQKQLLCLARAICRNAHLLLMDEASSSLDVSSDQTLQRTIRTVFKDTTVLTIAHRLQTIMDSDRILVLEQGQVAEFDTPQALLADENSVFSMLVRNTHEGM